MYSILIESAIFKIESGILLYKMAKSLVQLSLEQLPLNLGQIIDQMDSAWSIDYIANFKVELEKISRDKSTHIIMVELKKFLDSKDIKSY